MYILSMASKASDLVKKHRSWLFALGVAGLLLTVFSGTTFPAEVKPQIAEALNTGDTTRAIQLLEHEIEVDESYHINYYTLGQIYFNRMQWAKAKEQFRLALDKKSKHYESLYQLGRCYLKLDQVDSAQAAMEKGRRKAKKGLRHLFENGYGLVMLKQGNYQEADRAFRQALVDHPNNPQYLINLGDANFYQGVPALATTY